MVTDNPLIISASVLTSSSGVGISISTDKPISRFCLRGKAINFSLNINHSNSRSNRNPLILKGCRGFIELEAADFLTSVLYIIQADLYDTR
ncbi:MAG: hypothetical protein ACR2PX_06160, partial [Endozoicomonas sp.]